MNLGDRPLGVKITVNRDQVAAFCKKWKIRELSFFGSVIRDDFGPKSDVDVLVTFAPGAEWSLLDFVSMEDELGDIFGRKVDLVTRRVIERSHNWIRRNAILSGSEPVYIEG